MHDILATVGTDRDVLTFVGLGATLHSRWHRITLADPETSRDRAHALSNEFCPLVPATEVGRMLADPELWYPFRNGMWMARWGGPMVPCQYEALAGLAWQADTVPVANPGLLAARLVRKKPGVLT